MLREKMVDGFFVFGFTAVLFLVGVGVGVEIAPCKVESPTLKPVPIAKPALDPMRVYVETHECLQTGMSKGWKAHTSSYLATDGKIRHWDIPAAPPASAWKCEGISGMIYVNEPEVK